MSLDAMEQAAKFDQAPDYCLQGVHCKYTTIFSRVTYADRTMGRPLNLAYVHFRSSDRAKIQSLGDFWHLIILPGAVLIAQDEVDTYTMHHMVPPGSDFEIGDPETFVNETLGGIGGPSDIKVDEVIVCGKWQADLAIADSFRSQNGRVLLAGDAGKKLCLYPLLQ
jgi:hypothetical protein